MTAVCRKNVNLHRDMSARRLVILLTSAIIILGGAWLYLRPALAPEASIRASLLAQTPLGSTMDEVRALAERQGWIEPGDVHLANYMTFVSGTGTVVTAFAGRSRHDLFPYRSAVTATWEFDSSNRLVNVSVTRHD